MRLLFRALLQKWIAVEFPEQWGKRENVRRRANPLEHPVGRMHFVFRKTSFFDYMKEYYACKHADVAPPTEGCSLDGRLRCRESPAVL